MRHQALAAHLKALRTDRGLSLQDLATRSGVNRATFSRIEDAEVSPTAETLGRLAAALALPLSRPLAPLDPVSPPPFRLAAQRPPACVEVIECEIAAGQRIAYDRPAFSGHEHHLVLVAGALAFTVEGVRHELEPGDCLRYRLHGASCFETGAQPARYIIAMA